MDFDFGNLIYIILTLVFVIFGAMNKKKKPVQTPQEVIDEDYDPDVERKVEQPVNSINDNLKKLFGEFSEFEETKEVVEDQYVEEEEEQIQESILDTDYSEPELKEEEISVYRMSDHMDSIRIENAKSIAFKESKNPSFTQELFKEFDPKKALLYSEIFNPKYF